MKQKVIFFLIAMVMVVGTGFAQPVETIQKSRQLKMAEKQMSKASLKASRLLVGNPSAAGYWKAKEINKEIESLQRSAKKVDSTSEQFLLIQNSIYEKKLVLNYLKTTDKSSPGVKNEIDRQWAISDKYALAYDSIIYAYVTNPGTPKEMSKRELERRLRANIQRRQDIVYDVRVKTIQNAIATGDTMFDPVNKMFMGIITNNYSEKVRFEFCPLDGGQPEIVKLSPKSSIINTTGWTTLWLIEGNYRVRIFCEGGLSQGQELGQPFDITVGPRLTSEEVYVSNPKKPYNFNMVRKRCYFTAGI